MTSLYVDGSYSKPKGKASWGYILLDENEQIIKKNNGICLFHEMWQVNGELEATIQGLKAAIELNIKDVTIFYDFKGIQCWPKRIWKAKKPGSIQYTKDMDELTKEINYSFVKVKAHTDNVWNNKVDELTSIKNLI